MGACRVGGRVNSFEICMKAICTRCQGSGLEPHIETQTVNLNQYWKCNKCGMVSNFEPQEHKCKFEKDPLRQLPVKKPISKLGKAVI